MIVCTAILIFVLLIFMPITCKIDCEINLKDCNVHCNIYVFELRILKEVFCFEGKKLQCKGTVETQLDLSKTDKKLQVDLLKCITLRKVNLGFANNLSSVNIYSFMIQNLILKVATNAACAMSHCKIYSCVGSTLQNSKVLLNVVIHISIAELSFSLLKQGARQWKASKLTK